MSFSTQCDSSFLCTFGGILSQDGARAVPPVDFIPPIHIEEVRHLVDFDLAILSGQVTLCRTGRQCAIESWPIIGLRTVVALRLIRCLVCLAAGSCATPFLKGSAQGERSHQAWVRPLFGRGAPDRIGPESLEPKWFKMVKNGLSLDGQRLRRSSKPRGRTDGLAIPRSLMC